MGYSINTMPEISIIILTFNSFRFIKPCLDSILKQDNQNFEIIVIDNGSEDGTVKFVRENYPSIILIENKKNLGTCKARNQGIEISRGKWILTLDCDITLKNNFLSAVSKTITGSSSKIGMLQPKILKSDKKTIYSTGISLSFFRRFYDIGSGKTDSDAWLAPKYIFGACSAAACYNRQMLEESKEGNGYFDERFFFLVEDVDLAWRAQKCGWKGLSCPEAVCYHSGNSSGCSKKARQYLCYRNRYYTITKNEGIARYYLKIIPALFYDLPRLVYLCISNHFIWKSYGDSIKGLNSR